jgi:hypothetical protein
VKSRWYKAFFILWLSFFLLESCRERHYSYLPSDPQKAEDSKWKIPTDAEINWYTAVSDCDVIKPLNHWKLPTVDEFFTLDSAKIKEKFSSTSLPQGGCFWSSEVDTIDRVQIITLKSTDEQFKQYKTKNKNSSCFVLCVPAQ